MQRVWPRFWRDLLFTAIPSSIVMPSPLRPLWLNSLGAKVDRTASLASGVRITGPGLTIGARSFLNRGTFIDTAAPVIIGTHVAIAMNVQIITSSHRIGASQRRAGSATSASVRIGDGAWIGAGTIVLPGVSIGRGTVIAAGSVVSRSCEPDTLYAGIPARIVRRLDSEGVAD